MVFVPYLWHCRPRNTKGLLAFHDKSGIAYLDAGSASIGNHLYLAEQERLAEDIRLAYVALTRAESAIYLVWGKVGRSSGQTALAFLLHPNQSVEQLESNIPGANLKLLHPDLVKLAGPTGGDILVTPIPTSVTPTLYPVGSPLTLTPQKFRGPIATDWRVSSFTSLTKAMKASSSARSERVTDDVIAR
ncbi:MAG: hypothetical protein WCP34_14980, partial [Pseudomonadota bacterium]